MFQVEFRRFSRFCAAYSLLFVSTIATTVQGKETEQGTRQFAVAVGFQNQKLYESAIDEWKTFLQKYPKFELLDQTVLNLGTAMFEQRSALGL